MTSQSIPVDGKGARLDAVARIIHERDLEHIRTGAPVFTALDCAALIVSVLENAERHGEECS